MFWSRKPDSNPLGVPLGDLMSMLEPTSIKATLQDNVLLARHEHYTIRIEVVSPDEIDSVDEPIQAVVRMVTELPASFEWFFNGREASAVAACNGFAALGALYSDNGTIKIGSRLTIFEAEDSWRTLHLPLLLFTTICGSEAILGAFSRSLTGAGKQGGVSKWTERDFEQVEGYLSRICFCTTGGLGLTAEFGLTDEAVSAVRGDPNTALFQLMADQPHPELGGGLFCLLQMPHRIPDADRLDDICLQLNTMEMAARDLPPHFGAWCPSKLGNHPAYVMFLPNPLYTASGIAVNTGFWAMHRARWANATLASFGAQV